ncbi:BnaC03g75910D [Brassica napus]|uniref:BnaC03g75910D protein n=1 Tax=Brassica napus TaxID=3708 RepID=A0A078JMG9_BRANA|nr:BnaC03g75910D [Brassica napus]
MAIVTAKHISHIQATVVCAKSNGVQIRIRSGGHDYEGLSYISSVPFVILDMFNLRSITVDVPSKQAWVQAGATLGELYTKISDASETLAFPAGVCSTVGAGGHISGGGYGNLMRKYGLTVDHVVDALIVDVNGKLLNRSTMGEDLFWAIRGGGGGSFGVILSWKINLVDVPEILTVFRVNKTLEQGGIDVLYKWQLVSSKLPESLYVKAMSQRTIAVLFYAQFLGGADELVSIMNQSLPELGLKSQDCLEMSWLNSTLFWEDLPVGTPASILLDRPSKPEKFFKSKSDYVKKPIPKEGIEKLWNGMLKINNNIVYMHWNPYGGVMDTIPATATPFPHREGNLFKIQYYTAWFDANATKGSLDMMKELYEVAEPYVSIDEAEIYGSKYFVGNLKRLMEVKAKYDPENFFKNEQSIPPARVKQ